MILTCLKCLQLHVFLAAVTAVSRISRKDSRCLSEIFKLQFLASINSPLEEFPPSRWGLTAPIWPMSSMSLASTQLYPTGWSLVTWQAMAGCPRKFCRHNVRGNTSTGVVKYYPFHRNDEPTVFINLQPLGSLSLLCATAVSAFSAEVTVCAHSRARCSRQVPELHEIKRGDGNGLTLGAACTLSTLIEDKTPRSQDTNL